MKSKLMIAHGKTVHPYSKRKNCKVCQEVDKEFLRIFGENPDKWPFIFCANAQKIYETIKKRIESK